MWVGESWREKERVRDSGGCEEGEEKGRRDEGREWSWRGNREGRGEKGRRRRGRMGFEEVGESEGRRRGRGGDRLDSGI